LKRSQIIQLEEYFEGHHQEKSQEYLVSPFRDLLHYREVWKLRAEKVSRKRQKAGTLSNLMN